MGGSLKEQPWTRAATFGESDAHFEDLVPVHNGDGPNSSIPFDLVADNRRAAVLLNDELTQRHSRVQPVELEAVKRRDSPQFSVSFEHEVAEEAQIQTTLRGLAE